MLSNHYIAVFSLNPCDKWCPNLTSSHLKLLRVEVLCPNEARILPTKFQVPRALWNWFRHSPPPRSRNLPLTQLTLWQHSANWVTHWSCHRQLWFKEFTTRPKRILTLCRVANIITEASKIYPFQLNCLSNCIDWLIGNCPHVTSLETVWDFASSWIGRICYLP